MLQRFAMQKAYENIWFYFPIDMLFVCMFICLYIFICSLLLILRMYYYLQ